MTVPHIFKFAKRVQGSTQEAGKHCNIRSECINQLNKWHFLMEQGAITVDQYCSLLRLIEIISTYACKGKPS